MEARLAVAVAIAVVLCLPASLALAGQSGVNHAPLGGVDLAGVQAWMAQSEVQGLTAGHWAAAPIVQLAPTVFADWKPSPPLSEP